jgi:hypothetical protein
MDARESASAFHWIVTILQTQGIPFAVTGGLAARTYGSLRGLNDIDIDIPDDCFCKVVPEVVPYIVFGPARYKDSEFDLLLMTLRYKGQDIDISGAGSVKLRDRNSGAWLDSPSSLADSVQREMFGLRVPVVNKSALIAYKKIIARDIDLIDIEVIASMKKNA